MSGIINSAGSRSGVIGFSGDIVASGSNANGYYIKYSDGTMICRHRETAQANRVSCTGQLNSTGTKYSGNVDRTYPIAFVDNTSITVTASCEPSSANCVASVEAYTSASVITLVVWADRSTASAGYPNYIAIGKWK